MRPDAGPSHPKPDAIVLTSTCFQQQYGMSGWQHSVLHGGTTHGQFDSNIISERTQPRLIGYVHISYTNFIHTCMCAL